MRRRLLTSVTPAVVTASVTTSSQGRFFWGSWGSGTKASASTKSPKTTSVFSKMVLPGVKGSSSSANVPNGKMSMAEALSPSRVAAALDTNSGEKPDVQQQKLIDVGLELLEHAKSMEKYTAGQLQALDAVASLVFSETLSATLPVYEQLQVILDAMFLFDGPEHEELARSFLTVLSAFVPPDVVIVFENMDAPSVLQSEEERLAFLGCMKLALGADFESVSTKFDGAMRAGALLDRAAGNDMLGKAKDQFKSVEMTMDNHEQCGAMALVSLNEELHAAVDAIERESNTAHNALSRSDSKRLMTKLFQILLTQLPQLAEEPTFVSFAKTSAFQLRLQCEFVQLLAKLFAAFDPNETGKISFELLKASIERVSTHEKAEELLRNAHPDADGNIDYPVLLRVIRASR